MGRVKGTLIKRTSREVLKNYHDKLTSDFEKNKKVINQIFTTYKRFRNSIAGDITRIIKREQEKAKKKSHLNPNGLITQ